MSARGVVHENRLDVRMEGRETGRDGGLPGRPADDDRDRNGCRSRHPLGDHSRRNEVRLGRDDDDLGGLDRVEDSAQRALQDRHAADGDERLRLGPAQAGAAARGDDDDPEDRGHDGDR